MLDAFIGRQRLGVQPLLAQDEPLQLAMVRLLAEEALAWPPPPQSASDYDAALLAEQAVVAQLLAADGLCRGFQRFAAEPLAGSLGVQLARQLAALPLDTNQLPADAARSLAQLLLWSGLVAGWLLMQHWAAPIQ